MFVPKVKICGITNVADALCAASAGASAIGMVFYQPSPRNIEIEVAREISRVLPPFVSRVGLFVNAPHAEVERVFREVGLDLLQFHGEEDSTYCAAISLPYIKAIRVRSEEDVGLAENKYQSSRGLLVDAYKEGVPGGTGETFDWSLLPSSRSKPLILAGGLTPENVQAAIAEVRPYAVDVSGGVESARGIKDQRKIIRFIKEVICGCKNGCEDN
jgi:phosphoribosylanthranilate isomerase